MQTLLKNINKEIYFVSIESKDLIKCIKSSL